MNIYKMDFRRSYYYEDDDDKNLYFSDVLLNNNYVNVYVYEKDNEFFDYIFNINIPKEIIMGLEKIDKNEYEKDMYFIREDLDLYRKILLCELRSAVEEKKYLKKRG